jgi:hypothetical protein
MPNVIVVPETEEYQLPVAHGDRIWITRNLGVPQLEQNNATYVAPFWITGTAGVVRVYHITRVNDRPEDTELVLGNSFVLPEPWNGLAQHRRFEYHSLQSLGFVEGWPGMLVRL